ncbi:MAG: metabolite traffic protein EboE [Pseudomonadota bacterium]
MRIRTRNDAQLTYCTNVHPGETLPAVRALLQKHVLAVKQAVAPEQAFGVGLRLAASAADALDDAAELARFKAELEADGLYCFTLNGFPYGAFHATSVKEHVYLPDWQAPERVRYTQVLARVLAELLPLGVSGSISTVPGCFRPNVHGPAAERAMAAAMIEVVAMLVEIARRRGRQIALALEPEPACFLETTEDALRFFETQLFGRAARQRLVELADIEPADAERLLRRHIGVCLDTCHASVEFESPLDAWRKLQAAGIAVPKVQISAGLRLREATPEALEALRAFSDGVYLHQTVVQSEGRLTRYADLPDALAQAPVSGAEWRVHFHVPIFMPELGLFESTQADLVPLLRELATIVDCPHLEVETYTWDVLPEAFRNVPVEVAIARELNFVQDTLASGLSTAGRV